MKKRKMPSWGSVGCLEKIEPGEVHHLLIKVPLFSSLYYLYEAPFTTISGASTLPLVDIPASVVHGMSIKPMMGRTDSIRRGRIQVIQYSKP